MTRYQGIEYDQNNAPVSGAKIRVLDRTGTTLQTLTDDMGNALPNPVTSDDPTGAFYFNVATPGTYLLKHYVSGRLMLIEFVAVGVSSDTIFKGDKGDPGTGTQGIPGPPGYKSFSTYAALAATTAAAGDAGKVEGIDAGTHTDPVVGGTVANVGRYAYSTSPAGWKRIADLTSTEQTYIVSTIPPPTIDTGTSQTMWDFVVPDRTDADGTHSNTHISFSYAFNPYAAGAVGSGSPKHTNRVFQVGHNTSGSQGPIDTTQPAFYDAWEEKFAITSTAPGSPWIYQCERHIGQTNGPAGTVRAWTMGVPHDSTYYKYDLSQTRRAAIDTLTAGNGVDVIKQLLMKGDSPCTATEALYAQFAFNHLGNGYPWLKQQNAAGNAAINVIFIDTNDHVALQRGIEHDVSAWSLNGLSIYSAHAISAQNTPNNARLRYLSFNGASNTTITDVETQGSASTALNWNLENTHASGAARLDITSGGGPALIRFNNNGTFTSADLSFDGARIKTTKPFGLPTYTVSGLPSAASVGAGARAFVSDATTPAFMATVAGAGAVFTPVYSDGTNWKVG